MLDEATSNLNPETEARIEGSLGTVLEGRTAIVIAEQADRVVVLDRGRIAALGSHDDLVSSSEQYATLVSVWERGILR